MLWSIDSCQNRVSADQYHLTVSRAQVSTIKVEYFLKLSADNLLVFKWSQAQIFLKFISNMLCLCNYRPALSRFWFLTDLRCKNSASFFKIRAGKTFSYHGHVLVTLHVHFYDLIGLNLTGEFMCKTYAAYLESCLLWQLKLTEFWVNLWCFKLSFSTECAKWNTAAIKSLLLFVAGLYIAFLVEKCVACQSW